MVGQGIEARARATLVALLRRVEFMFAGDWFLCQ